MKNNILITGASGFIGRALITKLLSGSSNSKIILLSRNCKFECFDNFDKIIPVIGDINNVELITYILQSHKITHIYHLAAEAVISEYTKNPRQAYINTVQGMTSILEAVRVSGVSVEKVIVSTSYKVYGRALPPYNEETVFLPGNTYETAKACQDFIAQDYFRSFKIPVIIFRTVNVYGPGDSNLKRLVPKSFIDIYSNKQPTVYSSVKNSLREFLYIDDLIEALLILKEKAKPGEVYCIGGEQHSIYKIVNTICDVTGYDGGIEITEDSHIPETKEHAIDSSKLKQLGWSIKVSLKEGLQKTMNYYKK